MNGGRQPLRLVIEGLEPLLVDPGVLGRVETIFMVSFELVPSSIRPMMMIARICLTSCDSLGPSR